MKSLLIAYTALAFVHIAVDVACCLIARSQFRPLTMICTAAMWPVMWPATAVMAAVMLKVMKDAGLVPETKGAK